MTEVYLERPDLFRLTLRRRNKIIAKQLLKRGYEALASSYEPNLAVVIRTKNDINGLQQWLKYIEATRKTYKGRIDVIVVDTQSTDGTKELAEKHRAKLVSLKQSEFTYPKSINDGLREVANDVELAFITIGHAYPVLNVCIAAGTRHFADKKVAGAYNSRVLPHENSSVWEDLMLFRSVERPAHKIKKLHLGVMGATGCIVRMSVWRQHAFDEHYEAGAEDGGWARWAFAKGYDLVSEPAMAVYHTHGLSLINTIREVGHWLRIYYGKPGRFNQKYMERSRPDLFK